MDRKETVKTYPIPQEVKKAFAQKFRHDNTLSLPNNLERSVEQSAADILKALGAEQVTDLTFRVTPALDMLLEAALRRGYVVRQNAPEGKVLLDPPDHLLGNAMLEWGLFSPGQFQPRTVFDDTKLEELAQSILEKGILQNLIARWRHDGVDRWLEIVAGERRWRAVYLLVQAGKLPENYVLPVNIRVLTDLECAQIATVENEQRETMDAIDQARAYAQLRDLGMEVGDIAHKIGKTTRLVQQRLAINDQLHPAAADLYRQGKLNLEQLYALTVGSAKQQLELLDKLQTGFKIDAQQIRLRFSQDAILVSVAAFPLALYSGDYSQPDLFNDTPEYFLDAAQARDLQSNALLEMAAKFDHDAGEEFGEVIWSNQLPNEYRERLPGHTPPPEGISNKGLVILANQKTLEYRAARVWRLKPQPKQQEVPAKRTPPPPPQPDTNTEDLAKLEAAHKAELEAKEKRIAELENAQHQAQTALEQRRAQVEELRAQLEQPQISPTPPATDAVPQAAPLGIFQRLEQMMDLGDNATISVTRAELGLVFRVWSNRGNAKDNLRIKPKRGKATALELDNHFLDLLEEYSAEEIAKLEAAKPAPPVAPAPAPKPTAKPATKPAAKPDPKPKAPKKTKAATKMPADSGDKDDEDEA